MLRDPKKKTTPLSRFTTGPTRALAIRCDPDDTKAFLKIRKDGSIQRLRQARERVAQAAAQMENAAAARQLMIEQRESDRGIDAFWRRFFAKIKPIVEEKLAKRPKPLDEDEVKEIRKRHKIKRQRPVYMSIKYHGALNSKAGVARRLVMYITRPDGIEYDKKGKAYVLSNIGDERLEMAAGVDLLEAVNFTARKNAKLCFSMIVNLPHDVPATERAKIMRRYCDEVFGQYDLPYVAALHRPSPDGDSRNFHGHIVFSFRPMVKVGAYAWDISREIRTDFDNEDHLAKLREIFANSLNSSMKRLCIDSKYTHMSYVKRGLKTQPEIKLGAAKTAALRRGEYVADAERNKQIRAQNETHEAQELEAETMKQRDRQQSGRDAPRSAMSMPGPSIIPTDVLRPIAPASFSKLIMRPELLLAGDQLSLPISSIGHSVHPSQALHPQQTERSVTKINQALPTQTPEKPLPLSRYIEHSPPRLDTISDQQKLPLAQLRIPVLSRERLSTKHDKLEFESPIAHAYALLYTANPVPLMADNFKLLGSMRLESQVKLYVQLSPPLVPERIIPVAFPLPESGLVPMVGPQAPLNQAGIKAPVASRDTLKEVPDYEQPVRHRRKIEAVINRQTLVLPSPTVDAVRSEQPINIDTQGRRLDKITIEPAVRAANQIGPIMQNPLVRRVKILAEAPPEVYLPRNTTPLDRVKIMARVATKSAVRSTSQIELTVLPAVKIAPAAHQPLVKKQCPIPNNLTVEHPVRPHAALKLAWLQRPIVKANHADFLIKYEHILANAGANHSKAAVLSASRVPVSGDGGKVKIQPQSSATPTVTHEGTTPTDRSPKTAKPAVAHLPSPAARTKPTFIQTPDALVSALRNADCYIVFGPDDHLTPSESSLKKLLASRRLIYADQAKEELAQKMRQQDEFIHSVIFKARKPIRSWKEFTNIPFEPDDHARLVAWQADRECADQLQLRIKRILATFQTKKTSLPNSKSQDGNPQLFSLIEVNSTKTKSSTAGDFEVSLADFLLQLPMEAHKFEPHSDGGFIGKINSATVRIGIDYWKNDPIIGNVINETIRLAKLHGLRFYPVYPDEVALAMEADRREKYKPPNLRRAPLCANQTIIGGALTPEPVRQTKSRGTLPARHNYHDLERTRDK